MAREVSLDTMRSLRLNQVLSASLWQVGPVEAAALMSSPRVVLGGTRSVPSHDWSMERQGAIMGTVFPRSHMESPIVQYLQQRQGLSRDSRSHCESNNRGFNGCTSSPPSLYSNSQHLVPQPHVSYALPAALSCSTNGVLLSKFQIFLRQHIEAFGATHQDVTSRTRRRHQKVLLHQVGVRCRHCAHTLSPISVTRAVYFPLTTMGFYQASQNMCTTHLQCGLCPEMPESIKTEFAQLIGTKTAASSSAGGRAYLGRCAQEMGLVDTEHGVFVVGTIPEDCTAIEYKSTLASIVRTPLHNDRTDCKSTKSTCRVRLLVLQWLQYIWPNPSNFGGNHCFLVCVPSRHRHRPLVIHDRFASCSGTVPHQHGWRSPF
jgi:hypothetical protein